MRGFVLKDINRQRTSIQTARFDDVGILKGSISAIHRFIQDTRPDYSMSLFDSHSQVADLLDTGCRNSDISTAPIPRLPMR